jgi:formamidopyrimidine-DNA glycosylase
MPELLEVEYFRRLAERCAGRTILHIDVPDAHALADGRSPRSLRQAVVGRRIELARRHGKLLVLETDGPALGLRFGMTGGLVVDGELAIDRLLYSPGTFGTAWVRFGIRFDEGELLFHDPRRFGRVSLDPDESRMGPDAMAVTAAELGRALATRGPAPGPALKARLLDQSAIAGIGNLLGDEILWRASLAPSRPGCAGSTATWWPRWRTSSSAAAPTPVTSWPSVISAAAARRTGARSSARRSEAARPGGAHGTSTEQTEHPEFPRAATR